MNNLKVMDAIPEMSHIAIDKVSRLEEFALGLPQIEIETSHFLHAGLYTRTIMIPAGIMLTGALIKIPTVIIVSGEVSVFIGENTLELSGYNVLPASANRKQAFIARSDCFVTMIFHTEATRLDAAEMEFTDEYSMLMSRKSDRFPSIDNTGE